MCAINQVSSLSVILHASLPRSLPGHLLPSRNAGLDADSSKDEAHADPLHPREAMAEGDDGQDHGEHFAGDGDGDEENGGEGG